jgi:predicted methyltransferase
MGSTTRIIVAAPFPVALAAAALALAACTSPGAAPPAEALAPARVAEILASPDRTEADRTNDQRRKPYEMLNFIGMRPGMVALDLSAGGGYTSELLARTAGPAGRVYAQSPPRVPRPPPAQPEGAAALITPPTSSASVSSPPVPAGLAVRAKRVDNIVVVVQPFEDPVPAERAANGLDLVTLMFNYHDLGHMGVDRGRMNRAVFAALKSGGLYVIADHSGRTGTGISESGTLHRIEEAFLRQEIESAGFRFVASGNFLRNPNDPRDRNTPDPPQPKDEFVLKFVKP